MKKTGSKTEIARGLRKRATSTEEVVWEQLRNRKFMGLKFRRQHVLSGFVVDFYCSELRLALEIDGGIHESREQYDKWRQELIQVDNIGFLRISNENINDLASQLLHWMKATHILLPSPIPMGEGVGVRD